MSGQYTAGRVAAVLTDHGETMTLRRLPSTDVAVKGKRFGSASETVVNNVLRTTITVKLSNAEIAAASWPGPPRRTDQLIIAGRTYVVEEADARWDSGVLCMHILKVTG